MYSKGDHPTSKYSMWPSRRRSWIDQLQGSQSYPPFRSVGLNYAAHQEVSWEEQAFAEDTLMHVWPPRSYSCTFCRREFRSAQALGGHMNVHRRDRARLRQEEQSGSGPDSPAPADEQQSNLNTLLSDNHEVHHNPPPPDNHKFSPSSVTAVNYPKPNDPNQSASAQTVYDIEADEVLSVQKDLSQPAVLVVGNLKRKDSQRVDDKLENYAAISAKRRCIVPAEFPLLSRPNLPIQLHQLQKEVPMKSTTGSPIEELDLELRLGNCRPTVT